MNPFQQSLELCPRVNKDKRTETAWRIFNQCKEGNYLVHKTTRAGATTSLITESMNRMEKFFCLVPTNKIADDTIINDAHKFCEVEKIKIVHPPSNKNCLYNMDLIEQYPDLNRLPIMPIAEKCEECKHYNECKITEIFRFPECNGIVLTYHKLSALLIASASRPNTTAQRVLNEIVKSKNVILDEVHEMQYGNTTDLNIYDDRNGRKNDLSRYQAASEDFENIGKIILHMEELNQHDPLDTVIGDILRHALSPDYWKQHLSRNIINPCYKLGNKTYENEIAVGTIKDIIELTKVRDEYNLSMEDVLELYKMMSIVTSEILSINAIKDRGIIQINITCIDHVLKNMINSFVMSMQAEARRIFLTSATICSYDYSQMFLGNVKPINISFGIGGDPMDTNSKMLILADNKKYSAIGRESRYNKKSEIVDRITEILQCYGNSNCLIVTVNMKEARSLKKALDDAGNSHEVTYYKSASMMGVTATERIMIAVGIAHKPSNSFDAVSKDARLSKILLNESVHCDTWQAWSRVKDPDGKEQSLIFALGCCVEDCKNIVKWGFDRTLDISENKNGEKKKINVSCEIGTITTPKIIKCKTFEGMRNEAFLFKLPKVQRLNEGKPPILNNIGGFNVSKRHTLDSPRKFLDLFINRTDVFCTQDIDGRYTKKCMPVTENAIREHLKGNMTIGTYQLNKDSRVKWICFDIDSHPKPGYTEDNIKKCNDDAEEKRGILWNYLTLCGIPFVFETSGSPHSYHFWILIEPVEAEKAYNFGHDIRKALQWKTSELEIFPKQKQLDKKGYGNFVKLPLATSQKHGGLSEILVNGEFKRVFDSLDVSLIDISGYVHKAPEKTTTTRAKSPVNHVIRVNGKVIHEPRKCILEAVNKDLSGGAGNQLRVIIVRELHLSGMKTNNIIEVFKKQTDFNREITTYYVNRVLQKEIPVPVSCKTVYEQCGDITGCETCEHFGCCV